MSRHESRLLVESGPFLRRELTTPGLMNEVTLALAPVILAAVWFFGIGALLIVIASVAGAVGTEWLFAPSRPRGASLRDGSAVLTGILLALTLPPAVPLWMAFVGGAVGVGLGKTVFGGLGQNLFNPALVGRAFLQAAFPTAMTTWSEPTGAGGLLSIRASNLALPLMSGTVDAVSTATPLGAMKFEHAETPISLLLRGDTAGSLGETSAIIIIVCGLVLALRGTFDWRIPLAMLLSVAVLAAVPWWIKPEAFPSPWFMLTSGGLLFGAVYMATDPVTSPTAPLGAWVFGLGIGLIVVLIRLWGGLAEGVMYAILLMNSAAPLIEQATQPRGFGRGRWAG